MSDITIEQLMNRMPGAFLPDAAKGVSATIQYHLSGAEAGEWVVTIGDGKCSVVTGTIENASMTLTADSEDYKNIILGKLDPMTAFMQQKVKLKGNLNMALGLTKYFKMK